MKLTLTKIKTLPIGKKLSDGQGLCLTKTAPDRGRWEMRYTLGVGYINVVELLDSTRDHISCYEIVCNNLYIK